MSSAAEFHLFNLDQRILKAISDLKWKQPTDIQQAIIPLILEGKSMVVQAKTGSGKTAAFAIPIIHELLQEKQLRKVQCTTVLVLAPTKELCNQATKNFRVLCKYSAKSVCFVDLSQHSDVEALRPILSENPDVVIGTPARVLSHLRSGHFRLKDLRHLIVDEADLVFAFGYQTEMKELKQYLPDHHIQVTLLSATLDDTTKVLRQCLVKGGDWVRVELPEEQYLPSESQLTQYVISAEEDNKYTILIALFKLGLIKGKTLIFSNSVDRCFKLRLFLEAFGIRAALLNSELPVASRCHTIDQFNRGVYDYLLATDEGQADLSLNVTTGSKKTRFRDTEYGVSRGIDFQLVCNVINFDFPLTPSMYVHRVGRTARADQIGTALSFVNKAEEKLLRSVDALLNPVGEAAYSSDFSQTKENSIFKPYQFRLEEVDGFRYRALDVVRRITRKVVREARLKEIKLELLNSERLKGYFADHAPDLEALRHDKPLSHLQQPHLKDVPDYLIPPSLRVLMPNFLGRRRNRWRKANLNLGQTEKSTGHSKKKTRANSLQAKHKFAKKRRAQNPLFAFSRKKGRTRGCTE